MNYNFFKNIAFKIDAEIAHEYTLKLFHFFPLISTFFESPSSQFDLSLKVGRNRWQFPVGLAAGLDKNGTCLKFFDSIGFGAIEVGTVTPVAQVGNERPRLFRYPSENSIRNCMGFNNYGSDFLLERVNEYRSVRVPLGVNIGKNKLTANEIAYRDYQTLYHKFKSHCDYIVINVSSPNTPGLRENQTKEALEEILSSLKHDPSTIDLYVKIAPDINYDSIDDVVALVKKYKLSGIIATNTTIMPERGAGGVSGDLLYQKSSDIRNYLLSQTKSQENIEVIGVGGFSHYDQIVEFWKNGGRAIQIYSSFVYKGPRLLNDIKKCIEADLRKYNLNSLEELLAFYRES